MNSCTGIYFFEVIQLPACSFILFHSCLVRTIEKPKMTISNEMRIFASGNHWHAKYPHFLKKCIDHKTKCLGRVMTVMHCVETSHLFSMEADR